MFWFVSENRKFFGELAALRRGVGLHEHLRVLVPLVVVRELEGAQRYTVQAHGAFLQRDPFQI